MAVYVTAYPPAHNDTYVKATSYYESAAHSLPQWTTDPETSLTGINDFNEWASDHQPTNQRFHVDLGVKRVVKRIYYENSHRFGEYENQGVKDFTFWGSNTAGAFADLAYDHDTGWTALGVSQSTFEIHTGGDVPCPRYIMVANDAGYRYYAFKFANKYGGYDHMAMRRIELQILSFRPPIMAF